MGAGGSGDSGGAALGVLLVEGEPGIGRLIRRQLQDQGVEVVTAASVQGAATVVGRRPFAVAIIDLVLGDGSGLEVLDALRASGSTAHVIVTSGTTAEEHRAAALSHGADDYVVKPFRLRELTARVLAVRRQRDPARDALLTVGALTVDLGARQVHAGDSPLDLTGKEFDLLAYLAARPGHVFSREHLLRAVWQSEPAWQQVATVTEHIRRLRAKIETDPRRPRIVRTVRGAGYRLDVPLGGPSSRPGQGAGALRGGSLVHVDGRIVRADSAVGALLGLEHASELVGHQIIDLVSAGSKGATRARMLRTESASGHRTELIDLERADGTETSVEVASREVVWKGQRAERVTFTEVPDLSARLRRLVTGVLGELTDAVIITDLHFHVRSWNRAAERLYGWREQEVLGRHVLDVLQWVGDDGALAAIWENLELKGRWKGDGRQATRDGSVIRVLACTTLLRDHAGEPAFVVSVNRPTEVLAHQPVGSYDDDQIRIGIANDEFEVYYQPVVTLDEHRVVAMEALVRWNHPERGLLQPAEFIGAAEGSGTIIELGDVVFEKACGQAADWRRAGADVELAVNLSARQLGDPGLFDRVVAILAMTGLEPDHLWLEVTETALVEEVDRASDVLHALSDLGIGIAIDDFGTGWASLTYLRSFPIHALKIDHSFVAGVGHNTHDTAIARSILSLGAELGLTVIAEGIETASQQDALRRLGCTIGQGFLYGAAVPAGEALVDRARPIPPGATAPGPPVPNAAARGRRAPVRPTVSPISRLTTTDLLSPGPDGSGSSAGTGSASPGTTVVPTAVMGTAAIAAVAERQETDLVALLLRGLLRITSAREAAELLQHVIRQMGGVLVPAGEADSDTLPEDVSLGVGSAVRVRVGPADPSNAQLERLLPAMVDDAWQAVHLLQQATPT